MQIKNNINEEDIKVLKFLSKYKILKIEDASLIYKTKSYYRQRVNKLIANRYVKRYKSHIILDKAGRKILNEVGSGYIKNISNEPYMERLRNIASVATLSIDSEIQFIPSWDMKEKDRFTEKARRYIGKLKYDNKDYLVYYISSKKEHVYIKQVLFDINKALDNSNVIIVLESLDIIRKQYSNLSFWKKTTYIVLDTSANKEFLKRYEYTDIHELFETLYEKDIMISNWEYADYLIEDGRYIINMMILDTEKISRLNWFFKENNMSKKDIEIITFKEYEFKIKELLEFNCNIKIIDKDLLGGISEEL